MKLDKQDIRILAALQRDGRMTKTKLAEEVFLSPTACWERLRKLEDAGIIASYHARINLERFIKPTTVLVEVTLKRHQAQDFRIFEEAIQEIPEIIECHATGGGIDYLLKIVAPDVDHYQRLVDRLLETDIGIDRYFTYIVTKLVKEAPATPIELLLEQQL
ncbi:Lrp/AsnC family transcriptional regulator [Aestuariispira insulae]|uniref:AsnC family transcriptional regulator n=1 Tax=Aestuariispira insulae TaxID=1461337 RepID=A0A3D9H2N9_9PROT|nr:Lrp/AsnC family transcriptional regulator [Aestuariispira insulae]RED43773.1 AsnC family transcriptional regulator [Aestuariispira insulae]